jgi:hypothetical protein
MISEQGKTVVLQYSAGRKSLEGSVLNLPEKLARIVEYDQIKISSRSTSKHVTLWFRCGAKQIFHIRLLRKSGRYFIELSGLNAQNVLRSIDTCKQHFDQWFEIDSEDIRNWHEA